jgi:hypothetical protein
MYLRVPALFPPGVLKPIGAPPLAADAVMNKEQAGPFMEQLAE